MHLRSNSALAWSEKKNTTLSFHRFTFEQKLLAPNNIANIAK